MSLTLILSVAALTAGCSSDDVAASTCVTDTDCELGTVCGANSLCVVADCEFCSHDQICLVTDERPNGSCSAPQCYSPDDCPNGEACVNNVCGGSSVAPECRNAGDCDDGEICNAAGECIPDGSSGGCESIDDCQADAEFCDPASGQCIPVVDCQTVECQPGERCIEGYGTCQPDCTLPEASCPSGEYCDESTGTCKTNTCADISPDSCTPTHPLFDANACECVQCLTTNDCGSGRVCNGGVCEQQQGCATPCSTDQPGVCGAAGAGTPYCMGNCCVECVGAADCSGGELCIDGFCGQAPDCNADPTACPAGYECSASGTCVIPNAGSSCDPNDPTSCPFPGFCDPATNTCSGAGGDMGCGMCNPDCTCDGGLTCDGFFCSGCDGSFMNLQGGCPDGLFCGNTFGFGNFCIPNPF
ncbi:hypothetical protein DL240_00460 [Lujinxingia litoralis]|uniref:Disintegrin domain-containing protein n=2 Tax=Lujinxingia litoralis TaxID=2211119 RepID=A0A328CAP8_9DELT|nr:hypothetical protein DL240_00460 [Lujinxingia litoralis]